MASHVSSPNTRSRTKSDQHVIAGEEDTRAQESLSPAGATMESLSTGRGFRPSTGASLRAPSSPVHDPNVGQEMDTDVDDPLPLLDLFSYSSLESPHSVTSQECEMSSLTILADSALSSLDNLRGPSIESTGARNHVTEMWKQGSPVHQVTGPEIGILPQPGNGGPTASPTVDVEPTTPPVTRHLVTAEVHSEPKAPPSAKKEITYCTTRTTYTTTESIVLAPPKPGVESQILLSPGTVATETGFERETAVTPVTVRASSDMLPRCVQTSTSVSIPPALTIATNRSPPITLVQTTSIYRTRNITLPPLTRGTDDNILVQRGESPLRHQHTNETRTISQPTPTSRKITLAPTLGADVSDSTNIVPLRDIEGIFPTAISSREAASHDSRAMPTLQELFDLPMANESDIIVAVTAAVTSVACATVLAARAIQSGRNESSTTCVSKANNYLSQEKNVGRVVVADKSKLMSEKQKTTVAEATNAIVHKDRVSSTGDTTTHQTQTLQTTTTHTRKPFQTKVVKPKSVPIPSMVASSVPRDHRDRACDFESHHGSRLDFTGQTFKTRPSIPLVEQVEEANLVPVESSTSSSGTLEPDENPVMSHQCQENDGDDNMSIASYTSMASEEARHYNTPTGHSHRSRCRKQVDLGMATAMSFTRTANRLTETLHQVVSTTRTEALQREARLHEENRQREQALLQAESERDLRRIKQEERNKRRQTQVSEAEKQRQSQAIETEKQRQMQMTENDKKRLAEEKRHQLQLVESDKQRQIQLTENDKYFQEQEKQRAAKAAEASEARHHELQLQQTELTKARVAADLEQQRLWVEEVQRKDAMTIEIRDRERELAIAECQKQIKLQEELAKEKTRVALLEYKLQSMPESRTGTSLTSSPEFGPLNLPLAAQWNATESPPPASQQQKRQSPETTDIPCTAVTKAHPVEAPCVPSGHFTSEMTSIATSQTQTRPSVIPVGLPTTTANEHSGVQQILWL